MNELLNGLYVVDLETLDKVNTDGFGVLPLRQLVRIEFGAYEYEASILADPGEPLDTTVRRVQDDSLGLYFYPLDKIQFAHEQGEEDANHGGTNTYAMIEARFPGDDIHFPSVPSIDQLFVYEANIPDIEIAKIRVCERLGSGAIVTQLYGPVTDAVKRYRNAFTTKLD